MVDTLPIETKESENKVATVRGASDKTADLLANEATDSPSKEI